MSFVNVLLDQLRAASKRARSIEPFSFPEDILPDDDQEVQPVCSTFTNGSIVNIYRVLDGCNSNQYIYSAHGDGGVVVGYGGPYRSVEDVQALFDPVEEGWTDY